MKLNTLFFFIAIFSLQGKTTYSSTSEISSANEFVGKVKVELSMKKENSL
jgi:hypothetical protein